MQNIKRYKLTIADYNGMKKFTIKTIILFFLVILSAFVILNLALHKNRVFGFTYLFTLVCFVTVLILGIVKHISKETISINNETLMSKRFGTIKLKDIKEYEIKKYKNNTSVVISIVGGQKISIGPKNNLSTSTRLEFTKFLKEFETQLQNLNID